MNILKSRQVEGSIRPGFTGARPPSIGKMYENTERQYRRSMKALLIGISALAVFQAGLAYLNYKDKIAEIHNAQVEQPKTVTSETIRR
jgi:hypothetical protein